MSYTSFKRQSNSVLWLFSMILFGGGFVLSVSFPVIFIDLFNDFHCLFTFFIDFKDFDDFHEFPRILHFGGGFCSDGQFSHDLHQFQ